MFSNTLSDPFLDPSFSPGQLEEPLSTPIISIGAEGVFLESGIGRERSEKDEKYSIYSLTYQKAELSMRVMFCIPCSAVPLRWVLVWKEISGRMLKREACKDTRR